MSAGSALTVGACRASCPWNLLDAASRQVLVVAEDGAVDQADRDSRIARARFHQRPEFHQAHEIHLTTLISISLFRKSTRLSIRAMTISGRCPRRVHYLELDQSRRGRNDTTARNLHDSRN